jgi:putative membrane protein
MKIILKFILVSLVVFALPYMVSGVSVSSFKVAAIAAVVIGAVSIIIKPIISLITLPINLLTLGLFGIVVNGALLYGVAHFVPGFEIQSFTSALFASLVISFVSWALNKIAD